MEIMQAFDSHRLRVAVAAGRGDRKLLRTLLRETGVSVVFFCTAPDSGCFYTPLHMAAGGGHIGCVREILSWFATASNCTISEYVDWTTEDGCTALRLAVGIRNFDIVKLLLNAGGNVNIQDNIGLTPLHVAVIDDNLDMVKLLIDKGADVNAKDYKSWSCLHYVAGKGTTSVQHLDMVKLLVENGAYVNATDAESRYSLHYAAEKGFCGIVKILAPLCSLARYDTKEKTALYLAAENGHDHCLKILAEAGACVNTRAADFTTPLMAATKKACDKCVEVLLNHKADPNLHCSRVWPQLPIHVAAAGLNENILKRLIAVTDRAVDRCEGMVSPVYEAVDNPPMLKLLLSEGFSPEGQDCRNLYEMDSPLALVLSQDDAYELESVRHPLQMLMAAGASVTRDSWDACLTDTVLLSPLIHCRGGYTRRKQQWRTKGLFCPSELQALQSVAAQNADEAEFWLPTLLTAGLDPSVLLLPNFFRTADDKVLNYLLEMVNWSTLSPALTEVLQQRLRSKSWIPACPVDGFPSLLHLCRLKIRDILGSDVLMRTNAVERLPVPTLLRNFLTFSDISPP